MADLRIVDVDTIISKWHDLLKARWPNFPCQTFLMFIRNSSQELVRCKDCVCSSMCDDQLICSRIADVMDGYYRGTAEVVKPDDYCSHGIRQKAKPLYGGAER